MNGLLEPLTGVVLLDPWLLGLALLPPAALLWRRRRGPPAVGFAPAAFLRAGGSPPSGRRAPRSTRSRLVLAPRTLQVLALLAVAVALARPVERRRLPLRAEGIDIVICLDASSSMAARDMDPDRTRLEVARDAARRFIGGRPHDRIGLVGFARYPDLRCPPTRDHGALAALLGDVEMVSKDDPEDATGIGAALARAAQVLEGGTAPSKVVILLTDGDENVASVRRPDEIAPLHAAQLCSDLGIRVYSVVVGVHATGPSGDRVPLDPTQVRLAARMTGGRFYEAVDAGAMADVYASIDGLETVAFEEVRYEVEERFAGFLIAALGLLLAARMLEETVLEVLP